MGVLLGFCQVTKDSAETLSLADDIYIEESLMGLRVYGSGSAISSLGFFFGGGGGAG